MQKKVLQITVLDDGILHFGQSVYVVVSRGDKIFREKCPICDDTRKITVRDVVFDCPNCNGFNHAKATTVAVYEFCVREFIINKIEIVGDDAMSIYKKDGSVSNNRYPRTQYSGFTRYDSSNDSVCTMSFRSNDFYPRDPDKTLIHRTTDGDYCFLEKKDAVAFAKRLHERQQELLAQFNAEHGTNHKYPFEF